MFDIVGREQALLAVFAAAAPPGFVHRLHITDDVAGLEGDLRFVCCEYIVMEKLICCYL